MTAPRAEPHELSTADLSRVIEMAWDDRAPFDVIKAQFGLSEPAVIALMRLQLKGSSFRMWRKRVRGRVAKHTVIQRAGRLDSRHGATPATSATDDSVS